MPEMMVFAGNANPELTKLVCQNLGITQGKAIVDRFSDGEVRIEILENVRGKHIFVLQPTSAPTNDHLMELLAMGDALRRASAAHITAVVPYFGYARQDRRVRSARVPITAKVVADMITTVGFDRLITVDLHADQIQGFFYMPVDNVYSSPVVLDDIRAKNMENIAIVSPDVGGVVRARAISKRLDIYGFAIIDKRRPSPNQTEVMHIIGDVTDRHCILVDDIVDTAGTLCQGAKALKAHGAKSIIAYCTHPVLSGNAIENLENSCIDEIIVTDTIPLSPEAKKCSKIRCLSLGQMLAETIKRVNHQESISSMFD